MAHPSRGDGDALARRFPARKRKALFLDFDGVLQPGPGIPSQLSAPDTHFSWLPVLARVLRPYGDVSVVVHSSWRHVYNDEELRNILDMLGDSVVGATRRDLGRYESILAWLEENPVHQSYRILDDDVTEFPDPPPSELIICDPSVGLKCPALQAALQHWLLGTSDLCESRGV